MRRRWVARLAGGVVTGTVATVLLIAWGEALAGTTATGSPSRPGTAAAGTVLAIALLPATARYPRDVLQRATRVVIGIGFGIGTIGFAGYAGIAILPGPVPLLATGLTLLVVLPTAWERAWEAMADPRTLLAGDDPATVGAAVPPIDPPPVGYCAPPATGATPNDGSHSARAGRAARSAAAEPDPAPQQAGRSDRRSADASDRRLADGSDRQSAGESVQRRDGRSVRQSGDGIVERTDGGSVQQRTGSPLPSAEASRLPASEDSASDADPDRQSAPPAAERVGGLSELGRVVRDRGVDAVALRFATTGRESFFGALRVCHAEGVDAFVPRSRTAPVLVAGDDRSVARRHDRTRDPLVESDRSPLVAVELEPLPWYSRVAKRGFDLAFATVGIVALSPLMTAIALAIKLDSPGPVLYGQRRTGRLGETFQLLKFRSMVSDAEAGIGPRLSDEDAGEIDPRVTRVGRVLRATHLDELPQLFSILVGEMSVVGPRPERPALDAEIAAAGVDWEQRWFLSPGLTGLAQINGVTGFQPREKLKYDLEYATRQSLALDVRIVAIQVGQVASDVVELLERWVR